MNLPEAAGGYLVAESAGAEGDFFGDGAQARAEQLVTFGYAAVGGVGGAGAAALGLAVGGGLRGEEEGDLALGEQTPGVGCLLFDVLSDLLDGEARVDDELQQDPTAGGDGRLDFAYAAQVQLFKLQVTQLGGGEGKVDDRYGLGGAVRVHADAPGDGRALLAAVLLFAIVRADLGHVVAHAATPGQTLVVIAQGQLFNHEVGQQRRFEGQAAQAVDLGADDIGLVASLLIQVDVAVLHAAE